MAKKDVNLNTQRVSFSKRIKRKILLEVSKGRKPQEVFLEYAFDSFDEITKDKKYVAKLLYKWRQELYENKEILNFLNYKIDEKSLKEEISNIGSDDEQDHVLDGIELELKVKFNELVTSKRPIF